MSAFKTSQNDFEIWLKQTIGRDFVDRDLKTKHRKMRDNAFAFLRGTYWRWAETIFETCPDLRHSPPILAIGDIHIENFGAWRDREGRLIWGVNDFDDAAVMPYALDLVRLAVSVLVADKQASADTVCRSILAGYRAGLAAPLPIVLERDFKWLRRSILLSEARRREFWADLDALHPAPIPASYEAVLRAAMPDPSADMVLAPRRAGLGSLGRPRFVAIGGWKGGPVVREVKAVTVSAWCRFRSPGETRIFADDIANGPCRATDPHFRVDKGTVVRRLSPNSRKLEAASPGSALMLPKMLKLMGREIANCHAGDLHRIAAVHRDLEGLRTRCLADAAKTAAQRVLDEYADFAR